MFTLLDCNANVNFLSHSATLHVERDLTKGGVTDCLTRR